MKTELENNKITKGFTIPSNYFEAFSNELFEKINGEAITQSLPKSTGFGHLSWFLLLLNKFIASQ